MLVIIRLNKWSVFIHLCQFLFLQLLAKWCSSLLPAWLDFQDSGWDPGFDNSFNIKLAPRTEVGIDINTKNKVSNNWKTISIPKSISRSLNLSNVLLTKPLIALRKYGYFPIDDKCWKYPPIFRSPNLPQSVEVVERYVQCLIVGWEDAWVRVGSRLKTSNWRIYHVS